jgi:hypothetical protein
MATGFIYVVKTVGKDYMQPDLKSVPTFFKGVLYFGPCKIPMRPRMKEGDIVSGISPSPKMPRRVLFAARIAAKMTFREAYKRFPSLRGPEGPIHVRPARRSGAFFPDSHYEHIPDANHPDKWRNDIRTPELDAFFICEPATRCLGQWLGRDGPAVQGAILEFLRTCEVHGASGILSKYNRDAAETHPVCHGKLKKKLYTGLHLETNKPENFLRLVCGRREYSTSDASKRGNQPKKTVMTRKSRNRC